MSNPLRLSIALFPLVLSAAAGTPLAAQDGFTLQLRPAVTRAPDTAVELPLGWRGSMPTVEVWVHGEGPFVFAIDTGGQGSARVQPELIERLQLPVVGEIQGGDPTGRQTVAMPIVAIEHMSVGDVEFENVQAASRPYQAMPDGTRIDGILGVHLFSELVMTLDYANSQLVLSKPPYYVPRGATALPLVGEPDDLPRVNARLGDTPLELSIDTGKMGGLGVPPEIAASLTHRGEPRVIGRGRTITGEIEILAVQVEEPFHLGDLQVEQPSVEYADILPLAILGSKFLQDRVLTLDQTGRQLWIRDAEVDARLAERDSAPMSTNVAGAFEYPIDISTGRPWLQVRVGDREPDAFLFDTGAAVTVLDDDYARELGLTAFGKRTIGDPSAPQGIEVDVFLLEELSFGDAYFESLQVVAMDLDAVFSRAHGGAPKAILGLPTFTDCLVTLDYPGRVLRVERGSVEETSASPGVVLPFERNFNRGGLPEFELSVAGTQHKVLLDSGAPTGLSLPSSLLKEIRLTGEPVLVGQGRTVSATFDLHSAIVDGEIRLGSLVLPSTGVLFNERLVHGILGAQFLHQHVVTLDLANRRARFVPSAN